MIGPKFERADESSLGLQLLAVDAEAAAQMVGVSVRHWWALHSSGRCPLPIRMGRAVRWRVDELRQWVAAGAPERSRWETMQGGDPCRLNA